jgi:hypothetical protein
MGQLHTTAASLRFFFCGLFLDEMNEGISLSPDTLAAIGSRGLSSGLDIYGPDQGGETSI